MLQSLSTSSTITTTAPTPSRAVLKVDHAWVYYGRQLALRDVCLDIPQRGVTAFIGPSGCGKSTLLRCFNRLNDLIAGFRLQGQIVYEGQDLYRAQVDPVKVRRQIGMVFQKPNPFPKTIYDNVAYGARARGYRGDLDAIVERALQRAALWDEVKDCLHRSGLALSGGQQQRLCIARTIAMEPEVILMDEPCSALDPVATAKIEALIQALGQSYTIVIVTHNLHQAIRIADWTAFFHTRATHDLQAGYLVEHNRTEILFQDPQQQVTHDYIKGHFG